MTKYTLPATLQADSCQRLATFGVADCESRTSLLYRLVLCLFPQKPDGLDGLLQIQICTDAIKYKFLMKCHKTGRASTGSLVSMVSSRNPNLAGGVGEINPPTHPPTHPPKHTQTPPKSLLPPGNHQFKKEQFHQTNHCTPRIQQMDPGRARGSMH